MILDNAPLYLNRIHPPIDVLIETEFESGMFRALDERVRLVRVNRGIDGTPSTAIISTGLDEDDLAQRTNDEPIGVRHFAQLLEEIDASLRIVIQQTNGEGEPAYLFDGYPQRRTIRWNDRDQGFTVSLLDAASEGLRTDTRRNVIGRFMRESLGDWTAGDENQLVRQITTLACHFNAGGKPNRTADFYPVKVPNGDPGDKWNLHFFTEDNAPDAGYWTYAQALRYLLFWYVAKRGTVPVSVVDFMADTDEFVDAVSNPNDKNSFRRRLTQSVRDVRCDAVDAETAIGLLVRDAGLHFELKMRAKASESASEPWLPEAFIRVFAAIEFGEEEYTLAMGRPTERDIPRKAPFTAFEATADVANAPTTQDVARANAAQQAQLTVDHRSVNRPIYFGGTKRYECSLILMPGWLPFKPPYVNNYPDLIDIRTYHVLDDVPQTQEAIADAAEYWASLVFSQNAYFKQFYSNQFQRAHAEFGAVADVGRKWIFPTDARYASPFPDDPTQSPYYRNSLGEFNYEPFRNGVNRLADPEYGGGIADAALEKWIARRRPFLSPIARLQNVTTLAAQLEYKVGGDPRTQDGWYPYEGPGVQIDEYDSAIWIGGDNPAAVHPKLTDESSNVGLTHITLTDNWFYWIITQRLYLRVTCTIEGDYRLEHSPRPLSFLTRRRRTTKDLGERFRYQDRRSTNSIFRNKPADEDDYDDVKDIEAGEGPMIDYAEANAKSGTREVVSGDVEIPWLDYTYQLGDSIDGVAGLGIVFPNRPEIIGLQWVVDPNGGYRTLLMLSDLRTDPTIAFDEESGE